MTDNEMLEAVAEVAGLNIYGAWSASGYFDGYRIGSINGDRWDPLNDDGDALRLAVRTGIAITPYPVYETPKHSVVATLHKNGDESEAPGCVELYGDNPHAATRLAIVRCAAAYAREHMQSAKADGGAA